MSLALAYDFATPSQTEPQPYMDPAASRGQPPPKRATSLALSDRPTCRIYCNGHKWILQVLARGGWIDRKLMAEGHLVFKTLAAAVRYADQHGLDYLIVPEWRIPEVGVRLRRHQWSSAVLSGRGSP